MGQPGSWENPAVLITGAAGGIGRACVARMARHRWVVFAGLRSEADAAVIKTEIDGDVRPLLLDVTQPEQIEAAVSTIAEAVESRGLRGLVNNAGYALAGPLEHLDLERIRALFEVNTFGALALTQACLPMLKAGPGAVVNISSVSGRIAYPFLGPYAASKHALEAWSDSLRLELRPWGVRVSLIEPGAVYTPAWSRAQREAEAALTHRSEQARQDYGPALDYLRKRVQAAGGMPPEKVADAVYHALSVERSKARYVLGSRQGIWLSRLPTGLRDRIIARRLPSWGRSAS